MGTAGLLLVDSRVVRRVIKHQLRISGLGLHVPHDHSAVVSREVLCRLASLQELECEDLPASIILVAREGELSPRTLWRREFHGRIHLALEKKRRDGGLSDALVRARVHAIGQAEFDEIRTVLRQEDLILSRSSETAVYIEFAAFYMELRYFNPERILQTFPTIHDHQRILEILCLDLDPGSWLECSRPPEEEPISLSSLNSPQDEVHRVDGFPSQISPPSAGEQIQLAAQASFAEARNNFVRAAICHTRIALSSGNTQQASTLVDTIANRLIHALGEDSNSTHAWVTILDSLVKIAASGVRFALGVEARLLLDLQRACVDHEELRRTLDIVGWVTSWGRRPMVRELPVVRRVNVVRHLRAALHNVESVRGSVELRRCLWEKLSSALHRIEEQTREELRPKIRNALELAGLVPRNTPERVALRKLIEELLDQALHRGFIPFGVLRDGISRSNLKLPDLSGLREWWHGDVLLRADALLAVELDGVYRGGEIYMRTLQRGSSLFFGTPLGRALTLHLLLPVLASYVVLEGAQHLIGMLGRLLFHAKHIHLLSRWSLLTLAGFLYGLIHSERFRSWMKYLWNLSMDTFHTIIFRFPLWFLSLKLIQAVWTSRPVVMLWSFVLKPAVMVLPFYILQSGHLQTAENLRSCAVLFFLFTLFLNTKLGLDLQEWMTTRVAQSWRYLSRQVIPGIGALISDVSHQLIEGVDRALYAVDERLRFRQGDSRKVFIFKGILGVFWFFVTYLVRLGINVLLEPQINPIKHFPVVTVSHKILLPMTPSLASAFEQVGMGRAEAMSIAVPITTLTPGVIGFLVWELKGNWYLYARNRSATLHPVLIGHHGETMGALLKPGFHSGTVPKLFARMRQAIRQGNRKAGKYRDQLRDVEHAVAHFFRRELSSLLEESRDWPHGSVIVSAVELGSNRIRVVLDCPSVGADSTILHFEEQSGWLVASIAQRGWSDLLELPSRNLFDTSLAGIYRLAGVDLCREQIQAQLQEKSLYDVTGDGLVVWPRGDYQHEVIYPLIDQAHLLPKTFEKYVPPPPTLDGNLLLLQRQPMTWKNWLEFWKKSKATAL